MTDWERLHKEVEAGTKRMSAYQERRESVRKLRDFMDGPNAGTCPVCSTNPTAAWEAHKREVDRLKGALLLIAGQGNTHFRTSDGDGGVSLDADDKMRRIAREALKPYPEQLHGGLESV
jgi:hypothetical protein